MVALPKIIANDALARRFINRCMRKPVPEGGNALARQRTDDKNRRPGLPCDFFAARLRNGHAIRPVENDMTGDTRIAQEADGIPFQRAVPGLAIRHENRNIRTTQLLARPLDTQFTNGFLPVVQTRRIHENTRPQRQ